MNEASVTTSTGSTPLPRKPWNLYSPGQRWAFLTVLFLVSTSNYVDRNIISVLLVPIKQEFQVSDTMLGLLTGISFAIFYATLGIPVARLADRHNRKTIITIALTVWSAMTILCGLAQSFLQLALARIGVGAGESGAIPPAQSLIADYFPPDLRARALAVFMSSASAGYLLGFVLGAQLAAAFGWRAAFLVVGAPGFLLALVVHFVLKEPRVALAKEHSQQQHESTRVAFTELRQKKSYVYILIGLVLYFFMAYGALVFVPTYLVRVAGIELTTIGVAYGGVATLSAIIGTILGGVLGDKLQRRDQRWLMWLPAVGLAVACPLYISMFAFTDLVPFLILAFFAGILLNAAVPSIFSALHAVCGSARRAMAVAITFFFANLFGLGIGPVVTGFLSDAFTAQVGVVGLRYALMLVMLIMLPTAWLFYRGSAFLPDDIED